MDADAKKILVAIKTKADLIGRPLRFMELCGTHSQTVAQNGIKGLLPANVKLVSGPGCPVCVTDQTDIDVMVGLALKGIPIAAYGDALQVPGNQMSLDEARQQGAKVFAVYDVSQALKIQEMEPDLVFFGLGFETTTPMTAWGIQHGLITYSAHKVFPPAMAALLQNKKIKVDGFIDPGHVSAILGTEIYRKFKIPQVIAGFEGVDVLRAIDLLLDQILKKELRVDNEYSRVVKKEGNKKARQAIAEVFQIGDAKWRGLGEIKNSGLKIRKKYQQWDAEFVHKKLIAQIRKEIKVKPSACQCGLVLQGLKEPRQCQLFSKVCTPDSPQGACMVSIEGGCNIEFRYASKK
jgi:hydrogenase expression/formation protein HypD